MPEKSFKLGHAIAQGLDGDLDLFNGPSDYPSALVVELPWRLSRE